MKRILLFTLLISLCGFAHADLAVPGRFSQKIKLVNLDEYPEYEFYFMYANYSYNYGYTVSSEDEVVLENGMEYETSSRYRPAKIYARHHKKKNKRKYFHHSEEGIGGYGMMGEGDDAPVVTYKIASMKEGIITLERVPDFEGLEKSEVSEYKGGLETEMQWYFWLLPSLCLVTLVGFFLYRAKRKAT